MHERLCAAALVAFPCGTRATECQPGNNNDSLRIAVNEIIFADGFDG
jgi:hypothetical protein